MRSFRPLLLAASLLFCAASASAATRPYVTVTDQDGYLERDFTRDGVVRVAKKVRDLYATSGQPLPDVFSVWTTFTMAGNDVQTFFLPTANDIEGIGLEEPYDDELGVRATLLHNDITVLSERAAFSGAPVEGFASYLFLLELSHLWGPAIKVPEKAGVGADGLIGFTYHWSFFMDAGPSPAGGNRWIDHGDGTFSTAAQTPGAVTFTPLDLYLMGLLPADQVPAFGLLTDPELVSASRDPMTGSTIAKTTFPWFGAEPVTVRATRVEYTAADVTAANGARIPASSPAPIDVGIVLVVGAETSPEQLVSYQAIMDPIAASLAPAYARATGDRGRLNVITSEPVPEPAVSDAGAPPPSNEAPAEDASASAGGCRMQRGSAFGGLALVLALLVARRRRA